MPPNDGMPPQPKTQEFAPPDKNQLLLAELKALVVGGFARIDEKVDTVDTKVDRLAADLELQGGEIGVMQKEIALVFEWKGDVEQRLKNNSTRARSESSLNLEQSAEIAVAKAQAVAAKEEAAEYKAQVVRLLSAADRLEALAKKPIVQKIGYAAAAFVLQALAFGTAYLAMRGK